MNSYYDYRTGDLIDYYPPYAIGKRLGSTSRSVASHVASRVEEGFKKPEEDFMNAIKTIGAVAVVVVGGLVLVSILKN